MVMKVNMYIIRMRKTFPSASQNSASQYHFTANALMQLVCLSIVNQTTFSPAYLQVQNDADCNNSCYRDLIGPVCQDKVQC
jgi:hypothetical protein